MGSVSRAWEDENTAPGAPGELAVSAAEAAAAAVAGPTIRSPAHREGNQQGSLRSPVHNLARSMDQGESKASPGAPTEAALRLAAGSSSPAIDTAEQSGEGKRQGGVDLMSPHRATLELHKSGEIATPTVVDHLDEDAALDADSLNVFRKAFDEHDTDGTGTLEHEEMLTMLSAMGLILNGSELKRLLTDVETADDSTITFDEMTKLMEKKINSQYSSVELRHAFETFDFDGNGQVKLEEMKKVFSVLGDEYFTAAEVEDFMAMADSNGDGILDYEEFCQAISAINA